MTTHDHQESPAVAAGNLSGQVMMVIGGASGIGRAVVGELAARGARVVVGDIDLQGASRVAERAGGTAVEVDVSDSESVREALSAAVSTDGKLAGVCSTAGLLVADDLDSLSDRDWQRCLDVNLTGSFYVARHAAAVLRRHGGSLVLTSSTAGLAGSRGQVAYCAAKAGIIGLTRALADELAPDAIRVNCLCPGWVDTPFNDPVWEHAGDRPAAERTLLSTVPLRRQATPGEVAGAAAFLLAPESAYITGTAFVVDGGLLAVR
jgi:NAD(P)-dependent dehydrogenase (short-subunit alcohol dehydrogenase family)